MIDIETLIELRDKARQPGNPDQVAEAVSANIEYATALLENADAMMQEILDHREGVELYKTDLETAWGENKRLHDSNERLKNELSELRKKFEE